MQTRSKTPDARPSEAIPEVDNEEQSRLFIEKAREIGADEEGSNADALLGKMAKTPPHPRKRQK